MPVLGTIIIPVPYGVAGMRVARKKEILMYRSITGILTLTICLLIAPSVCWSSAVAEEAAKPEPVAVVDGVPIPMSDFEWEMRSLMVKGIGQPEGADPDSLHAHVINDLIDKELLYQEGVKAGFSVEKESVQAQIDLLTERFPDREVFLSALSDMNMTEEDLQRQIERGILIRKYVEEAFVQKAQVTDQALEEFYKENPEVFTKPERVRARHILREVDPDGPAEDVRKEKELLQSLRDRVEKGEDFGELAREHSTCPSSSQDGDLGFFGRGEMVKEFEDAAFALEPGEVSDIVQTMFGFHLIWLMEKQPEGMVPLAEVRDRLTLHLKQEQGKEALTARLKELKETVPITRMTD